MKEKMFFFLCLLLVLFFHTNAFANPQGPRVVHGQAGFSNPDPNTLNVTNSPNAIVNWQGFSIQQSEITRFIQQSANSAVLNRVVGQDPSHLLGQLLSNGHVFLINPHGMVFGPNAIIDTAGFVASTLNITDKDFLEGNLHFEGGPDSGSILNQGYITAGKNGDIYLIAPNIENSGIIHTEGGNLLLAAGESITITSLDTKGVHFEIQAQENEVLNIGKILADGGAAGIFAGTLKHSGEIRADTVAVDETGTVILSAGNDINLEEGSILSANGSNGGTVYVESENGTTWVAGTVEAKGTVNEGGNVQVLGERVALLGKASIDVSGGSGGGEVLVGGDYQGKNSEVKNARQTYVGEEASIRADAISEGDGGKVIVWGNDMARMYGTISARGGAESGDG
ncbi:filamentous hemagglutinin N-terminal domain-containing protein, partial [Thermodesulfobacteriota bacterium]